MLEKQKENIKNILSLIQDNPDFEILPMVATECIFSDDFSYWMGEWGEAIVDKYYISDERVYQYCNDFDTLVEEWIDNNYEDYKNLSDDELEKLAEETVNNYKWIDAIIVYIEKL